MTLVVSLTTRYRYLLAILNGATRMIECGTSFGVTTIYMALAVNQNNRFQRRMDSGVVTIEKDERKVQEAKGIWKEAGEDVENCIRALEGDMMEILQQDELLPPVVDLVFLDGNCYVSPANNVADKNQAWTSLALPALKLLLPRLRNGSIVVADRTITGNML